MGPDREELSALFVAYRETGDRALRDQLAEAHLPLATHLAKRFDRRGEPLEDLIQVACLGLLKAIDRFEPDRAVEFSTFAVPTIVGELKRHFRDRAWSVRVPRRIQELHLQLGTSVGELTHELGRSPTIAEVAERVGASMDDVLQAMEAGHAYRSDSLDARGGGGGQEDASPLSVRLGAEDPALAELLARTDLDALLATLPEREHTIIVMRFFAGMTQSEIADRVGVSQMQVSRLLTRTLEKLRAGLQAATQEAAE
jgi:RNA polymerase sigma-B factor